MVGVYRRLSMEEGYACPTLVTSPVQRNTMAIHPLENRPLSINEYKRAQGIPEDYEILGSTANKYKFIGNAVPFEMARAISKSVFESLEYLEKTKTEERKVKEIMLTQKETIKEAYQLSFSF